MMIPADRFRDYLFAAEQAGVVPAFLTQHFGSQGGTFDRLAEQIYALLESDGDDMIRRLHAALPDNFAPKFITHYALACLAAKSGDVMATHQELCHAARIGITGQAMFSKDHMAPKVMFCAIQQAFAIDPKFPALLSPPPRLPQPSRTATGAPVVLAACNGLYFERFGPGFLASAAPLAGLRCHVHVVNPTRETEALFARLSNGAAATLSLTCDSGPTDASYYACKRFLIAGEVMDRFNSDLIITDIDTVLMPAILDLIAAAGDADCGLFERSVRTAPMEICHCSLSFFRRTESARRLLQLMAAYLPPKLDEYGVWMLDQSALFTLSRMATSQPDAAAWAGFAPLRWRNLSELPGISLAAVNPNQAMAQAVEEKHALRGYEMMGDIQISLGPDGRPSFTRG